MRWVAIVGLVGLVGCAKAPEAGPTSTAPAAVKEIALAVYPDTEAVKTLRCEDLCGKPDRVPACPRAKRDAEGTFLCPTAPAEPPECRGGTGVMDGNMAEFEYIGEPFPRAVAIGDDGCQRTIEVSSYGSFKVDGLPAGTYLVRSRLDEFGREVVVPEGGTVKVDLQPVEAEYVRREERRRECGCPTDYKKR